MITIETEAYTFIGKLVPVNIKAAGRSTSEMLTLSNLVQVQVERKS